MQDQYVVVIAIGRNVGRLPMSDADWFGFRKQVANDLSDVQATVLQRPKLVMGNVSQVGEWEGHEEESCTFIATLSTLGRLSRLQRALILTRTTYKQDAIGFIVSAGTRHLL